MAIGIGSRQFVSALGGTVVAWSLSEIIANKLVRKGLSDQ